MGVHRLTILCLGLLLAAAALAGCDSKSAPTHAVVLQCRVDTDCMLNRVCDGGQCKMRSANTAVNSPSPAPAPSVTGMPAVAESDHDVGVDPDVYATPDAAEAAHPEGAQANVGQMQADGTTGLAADALALEQERARLERERVADEKRRLERERRELERQRKKIAEQRAAEQEAREREEQEIARRQAETPDALYESRRHSCAKGFLGSNCRKRIREQVCDGHWSPNPPDGFSTCKLK